MNGQPNGVTAMSKLVGTPAAIVAKMLLNSECENELYITIHSV